MLCIIADLCIMLCNSPPHGGQMELCVIRGYALSEVCVKRGSTVTGS